MGRPGEWIDATGDRQQPLVEVARQSHPAPGVEGRLHQPRSRLERPPCARIGEMIPEIEEHRLADRFRRIGGKHVVNDSPPAFDFPGPAGGVRRFRLRVDLLLTAPRRCEPPPQILGRSLEPVPTGGALVSDGHRRPRLDERADDVEHDVAHSRRRE